MKNITVSVPVEVYKVARVRAAEQGRSLSSLVAEFLLRLSTEEDEFAQLEALQRRVHGEIREFRAADRLERDKVHNREIR